MTAENSLSIIIPAYKKEFLRSTLESISSQSNKNFHTYIGDDASPADIYAIVKEFKNKIPLSYTRFEENLGTVSLTRHWERCIGLSLHETYLWLFSDDDVMPPDAVQRFYDTLAQTREAYPVYRFELALINKEGKIIGKNHMVPEKETGLEFTVRRLKASVHSAVIECIFKREVYNASHGFVEFPLAWCSDSATWAKFAGDSYIYSIPGKPLLWRTRDSTNISSSRKFNTEKFEAHLQYLQWISQTYPQEYRSRTFAKLIYSYLMFVCTNVMKRNVSFSQLRKITALLKSDDTRFAALLFIPHYRLKSVYIAYRNIRRRTIRYLKKA